ncbi:PaaI family thioesterase [Actinokineospora sp. NBRC 105648]|uniref:PaaI family thioesterase n=1 Tax=Actinokineospora sp. NBRC 105648 TaxID=3032206 RepID=UPI0024A0FB1A|nr:PaaI family thioesterase [Actinokineospora sp. NBRC 105648]GLZ37718.1 aromatic compound degradation protein PaaI [Actinokineospora sp. NBRC 105648]
MLTVEQLTASMPFAETCGVVITSAAPEEVRAVMDWDKSRCTVGGVLHGGALITLADSAGAVCAFLNLPEGATGTSTIETKTNLFRAVREGRVEAVSTPLHVGRTTIVVETDLWDAAGKRVARTTQTQSVLS